MCGLCFAVFGLKFAVSGMGLYVLGFGRRFMVWRLGFAMCGSVFGRMCLSLGVQENGKLLCSLRAADAAPSRWVRHPAAEEDNGDACDV